MCYKHLLQGKGCLGQALNPSKLRPRQPCSVGAVHTCFTWYCYTVAGVKYLLAGPLDKDFIYS